MAIGFTCFGFGMEREANSRGSEERDFKNESRNSVPALLFLHGAERVFIFRVQPRFQPAQYPSL
jgi:hypothetical protein